jgi:membrane protein DedA with SNARE-associated domain
MEYISIGAIRHFVEIHAIIVYLIIFIGVIFEGEIMVIFAGIFSYLGSINVFIALISVLLGGATKSFLGYTIGFYLNKHHSHRPIINKIERRIAYFLPKFNDRPFWSIFVSRFFILGIGWFTIVFSGYRNIPLKLYTRAEGYSLVLWSILMLALGYFFGYTALSISRDIRNVLLMILAFFIIFFVIEKIVAFMVELFSIKEFSELE